MTSEYQRMKLVAHNALKFSVSAESSTVVDQFLAEKSELNRNILDVAINEHLRSILQNESKQEKYAEITKLIDTAMMFSEKGFLDDSIPLQLLGDVFDSHTIDICIKYFAYLESRLDRFTKNLVPNKGKGLVLLRTCNDLLRRLSKSKNAEFCGRINILLASAFPLCERSALNLRGAFNTENTTTFSEDSNQQYYKQFWSLQSLFANPALIFDSKKDLPSQCKDIVEILQVFKKNICDEVPSNIQDCADVAKEELQEFFFFPKFLTNPALFELQLKDFHFQRHILSQLLILFSFLEYCEPSSKGTMLKPNGLSLTLVDPLLTWVKNAKQETISCLENIGKNGAAIARALVDIIHNDHYWIDWKANSCPNFERSAIDSSLLQAKREIRWKPVSLETTLSNNHFDPRDLLNTSENLKNGNIGRPPTTEQFFETYLEQLDPANDVEKEYRLDNDPLFVWRGLRLLTRKHLHLFQKTGRISLEGAMQDMLKTKDLGSQAMFDLNVISGNISRNDNLDEPEGDEMKKVAEEQDLEKTEVVSSKQKDGDEALLNDEILKMSHEPFMECEDELMKNSKPDDSEVSTSFEPSDCDVETDKRYIEIVDPDGMLLATEKEAAQEFDNEDAPELERNRNSFTEDSGDYDISSKRRKKSNIEVDQS